MENIQSPAQNIVSVEKLFGVSFTTHRDRFVLETRNVDSCLIICCYNGEVEVKINDFPFLLGERKMIIVPEKTPYGIKIKPENGGATTLMISLKSNSNIPELFSKIFPLEEGDLTILNQIVSITYGFTTPTDNFSHLLDFAQKPTLSSSMNHLLEGKLKSFLTKFANLSKDESLGLITHDRHLSKQKIIENIDEYLRSNVNNSITLDDLSTHFNISISYISSIYKASCGKSILQSFNDMKIEAAKKYICQPEYNLTQVADLLGFSSIHYFSRFFKKKVGMSPTQYQESVKQNNE